LEYFSSLHFSSYNYNYAFYNYLYSQYVSCGTVVQQAQKYCCKWGWTLKQSATNRYQQRFRQTNNAKQQFLTSTKLQSQAAVPGWTL
jgi:hypothetical protein